MSFINVALVIVDMQRRFHSANNPRTNKNVLREVHKAKMQEVPILALEYIGFGPTKRNIRQAIGMYPLAHYIAKRWDDGSNELSPYLDQYNINYVKMVGVNFGACVKSTAAGILYIYDTIIVDVIRDACHQPRGWSSMGYSNKYIEEKLIGDGVNVI